MTVLLTSGPTQAGEKHTKNNNKQTKPRFMSAQQVSPLHIGNCPQPRTEIKTKEKQVTVLLTSDLHISPTQAGWRGKKKEKRKRLCQLNKSTSAYIGLGGLQALLPPRIFPHSIRPHTWELSHGHPGAAVASGCQCSRTCFLLQELW